MKQKGLNMKKGKSIFYIYLILIVAFLVLGVTAMYAEKYMLVVVAIIGAVANIVHACVKKK